MPCTCNSVDRASSVGIATRYGLDGTGIEYRWGGIFSAPVQTGPRAHAAPCTMGTGYFRGVKRLGNVVNHLRPSSAEVEERERVELYLYSPPAHSWPVTGWMFLLTLPVTARADTASCTRNKNRRVAKRDFPIPANNSFQTSQLLANIACSSIRQHDYIIKSSFLWQRPTQILPELAPERRGYTQMNSFILCTCAIMLPPHFAGTIS
jgi:hypothetical protein